MIPNHHRILGSHPRNKHMGRHIQGFSLLEALVTLVVVSIGVLGILGLQTASLVSTRSAALQSNAMVAASNFAARMHANPQANYDDVTTSQVSNNANCDKGFKAPLTASQYKTIAVCEWSETLQDMLPNGRGYVECVNKAPCDRYRITITWHGQSPATGKTRNGKTQNAKKQKQASKYCSQTQNTNRCLVTEVRL